jgi:phosphoribosyl 1,2-cyclic phosphate phosphodiesterase
VRQAAATLVDAPPDLRQQLLREQIVGIDNLLLTHAHYDHSGGLGELEFLVRTKRGEAVPAYMTAETWSQLESSPGVPSDCMDPHLVTVGQQFELDGVGYTALEVTHALGTVGLLMDTGSGSRTAYIPDTGPLPVVTRKQIRGVDTLILGASFWGRNWMPDDHLTVDDAIAMAREAEVGELYVTHVSMHYDTPITSRDLEAYLRSRGPDLHLAQDGLQLAM